MSRSLCVVAILASPSILLAGCLSDASGASSFESAFGAGAYVGGADPSLRGEFVQANVGGGWAGAVNVTVDAEPMRLEKPARSPGMGTSVALPMPAVDAPIKVRLVGRGDLSDFRVQWGFVGSSGATPSWGEPVAAAEEHEVRLTQPGTTRILARVHAPDGSVAVTALALKAHVNVRWTVESDVWPVATPSEVEACADAAEAFVCAGSGFVMACVFAIGQCHGVGVGAPPVPSARAPGELADALRIDVPSPEASVLVETRFRGEPSATSGTDVDVALKKDAETVACARGSESGAAAVWGLPSVGDPQDAEERLLHYGMGVGAWTVLVGAVDCPRAGYLNAGPVPYEATIVLRFGMQPPAPPAGMGSHAPPESR